MFPTLSIPELEHPSWNQQLGSAEYWELALLQHSWDDREPFGYSIHHAPRGKELSDVAHHECHPEEQCYRVQFLRTLCCSVQLDRYSFSLPSLKNTNLKDLDID